MLKLAMANYSKGLKLKEEIVDQATELFGESGYFGTSIQKVATGLGLTQSAVFHHFKTKKDLFEGCVMNAVMTNHGKVTALTSMEDDAKTRLQKHFSGNLDWCFSHPNQAKLISLLFYLATYDEKMRAILSRVMGTGETRVYELLLAGSREGIFTLPIQAELLAKAIHDELFGHLLKCVSFASEKGLSKGELLKKLEITLAPYEEGN